ncbi:hypothetical protein [Aliarcobacter butzleri]|uniref:hypothetical protein n=1 Tax=Aliarcobacter butzleri TaxID=28197 RepID=UPI001EDA3083|nr:hypothetical protein [Aliarcobacter butzleri]MCG3689608.1 hypothetical protein [Aliarcobacter butzleri]
MEISDNKILYTNYLKTKKPDSIIPLEVFKIETSQIIENTNKTVNNYQPIKVTNYIYENRKRGTDKNALVSYWFRNNAPVDWEISKHLEVGSRGYEWCYQMENATFGNVYEDAKEFEEFVAKWIEKGYSEAEALERASFYAVAGVLDYGKQKAYPIPNLDYDDKKQHGFHLIDNPPLKKAFLETLDSLDLNSVSLLVFDMFPSGQNEVSSSFQELLNQYGVKLEDLKKQNSSEEESKFTFKGNININEQMSLDYQNFIFDTLIGFFKDKINSLDKYMVDNPQKPKDQLDTLKSAYDILIENFKKNTKEYSETKNILNQYLK